MTAGRTDSRPDRQTDAPTNVRQGTPTKRGGAGDLKSRFQAVGIRPVVAATPTRTSPEEAAQPATRPAVQPTKAVPAPADVDLANGTRHVTILDPDRRDWLEDFARELDLRIRKPRRGRAVAMNDVIRAALDEVRADSDLQGRLERRIRETRATQVG